MLWSGASTFRIKTQVGLSGDYVVFAVTDEEALGQADLYNAGKIVIQPTVGGEARMFAGAGNNFALNDTYVFYETAASGGQGEDAIWRAPLAGGEPERLAAVPGPEQLPALFVPCAASVDDSHVYFATAQVLFRLPVAGGELEVVFEESDETRDFCPIGAIYASSGTVWAMRSVYDDAGDRVGEVVVVETDGTSSQVVAAGAYGDFSYTGWAGRADANGLWLVVDASFASGTLARVDLTERTIETFPDIGDTWGDFVVQGETVIGGADPDLEPGIFSAQLPDGTPVRLSPADDDSFTRAVVADDTTVYYVADDAEEIRSVAWR